MKIAICFLLLTILTPIHARTFYCSFSDQQMGVLQIDINQEKVNLCQYIKNDENKWKQIESGTGEFIKEFFDNSSYQTKLSYKVITLKREVRFNFPKNFNEGSQIGISWDMASKFGPYISAGYSRGTSAICFQKLDAAPCVADKFVQPKNTPKNFDSLKRILENNEKDWWGDKPTFTLVSPNLDDFTVYTEITPSGLEACSFGCVSSYKNEIIQKDIFPKLNKGWTIVPIYSNPLGQKLFKAIAKNL